MTTTAYNFLASKHTSRIILNQTQVKTHHLIDFDSFVHCHFCFSLTTNEHDCSWIKLSYVNRFSSITSRDEKIMNLYKID